MSTDAILCTWSFGVPGSVRCVSNDCDFSEREQANTPRGYILPCNGGEVETDIIVRTEPPGGEFSHFV